MKAFRISHTNITNTYRSIIHFSESLGLNPLSKNYGNVLISEIINEYTGVQCTGSVLEYRKERARKYISYMEFLYPYTCILFNRYARDNFYSFLRREFMPPDIKKNEMDELIRNETGGNTSTGNGDWYLVQGINHVYRKYQDKPLACGENVLIQLMNLIESSIINGLPDTHGHSGSGIKYPKTVNYMNEYIQMDRINEFYIIFLQNIIKYLPVLQIRLNDPEWKRVHFLQKLSGKPRYPVKRFELNGKLLSIKWISHNSEENYGDRARDHISLLVLNSDGLWDVFLPENTYSRSIITETGHILETFVPGNMFRDEVELSSPVYWNPVFDLWTGSCVSPEKFKRALCR